MKNWIYNFFSEIDIKHLDPNNIKIDEKSFKNFLFYYIGYVTSNSIKPLQEHDRNKYVTLVLIDTGKDALKKYGDLWKKIKDLIRPTSSNNHDKKYMKIIR